MPRPRKLGGKMVKPKMSNPERLTSASISRFSNREEALDFANNRAVKPLRVILGDDRKFWVVTPAVANRLVRQGYEYAD